MSGPWDRPSSRSPDDPDWPASDPEAPARDSSAADPWSSEDPWSETPRDPAPAWDVWPSPAPVAEDYVDEPEPPSSDPWAESWTDEGPDMPFVTDSSVESAAPHASSLTDAPRVEPWAPDEDPWDAATAEPWRSAEPWRQEPAEPLPSAEPRRVEQPTPGPDLDGTPESEFEMPAHRSTEPPKEIGLIGVPVEPALEPALEPGMEEAERSDEGSEPAWEADPWAPATAEEADALEEEAEALPTGQLVDPAPERPPQVEPEPPRLPDAEPRPEPEPGSSPEPEPPEHKPRPEPEPEPEPSSGAETEPVPEPAPPPEDEPWPAPDLGRPPAPKDEPQTGPWPAPDLEPAPPPEDEPPPQPWPERGESTQVLPTTWRPPPPPVREGPAGLEPAAGPIRTALAGREEPEEIEAARPSTAEQAVPWLIGGILLLAGMVIVLLALIFAGDASLGGAAAVPSESALALVRRASSVPAPSPSTSPTPRPTATGTPTDAPSSSATPTPTPEPLPAYGALEMIYQGRSAALAPIYLLKHDFTTDEEPTVFAQDPTLDVRRFAWAPDGTVGAGLLANVLVSIEPGKEKRRLGDDISTITFGDDAGVVYAVRVGQSGANEVATVLAIDFTSGDARDVASVTYPRPDIGEEDALAEAQFADEGGVIRLAWLEEEALHLWSFGAGSWRIEPGDGAVTKLDGANPALWSPDGDRRITLTASGGTTSIRLHSGDDDEPIATTSASGRVSHVRWSPGGQRVTFTLGRSASGGGVLQDLFLWDLADGEAPTQLTSTGAAFGAEWRGSQPLWREP